MNRSQTDVSNLLLLQPKMPSWKLRVKTWCVPRGSGKCLTCFLFLGYNPKGPTSPSQSRDVLWPQLSPGFITPNTSHCSKHQGVSCTCIWFPCSNSYGATFKRQEQSYNHTSLLPWGKTVLFDKRLSERSSVWYPPRLLFCYILPVSLWEVWHLVEDREGN